MSRYDHFRQWLTEQSPRSTAAAPSTTRARYTLPEYRLPPTADPQVRIPLAPAPVWVDPQGMVPPVFSPYEAPTTPTESGGAILPNVHPSPAQRAIAPPLIQPVYSGSLGEPRVPLSRHQAQPSAQPDRPQKPANPAIRRYSYGLVLFVWLTLLGVGGYAMTRLLDPVFVRTQATPAPSSSSPSMSPPSMPSPEATSQPTTTPQPVAPTQQRPTPAPAAIAPAVPSPFDYADATPRPNTSPIWALVAVITASALGSRLMGHHAQQRSRRR